MTLESDAQVDRHRLKRRVSLWRALFVLAVLALALTALEQSDLLGRGDHVAAIEVKGVIVHDREREKVLRELAEDDDVKALLVRINSPGGTVVGGERLYSALRRFAESKPVVVTMETVATSAGYMVALGADRIFANQGTITGSVGVILQTADVTEMLAKIGVKPETIKTGPLKAVPSPLEPLTEEARAATQRVVDQMLEFFVALLSSRRDLSKAEVGEMTDGRIFTGQEAADVGLIDALGGEEEAKAWLAETHDLDPEIDVIDVEVPSNDDVRVSVRGLANWIFGEKSLISERLILDGLVSLWHGSISHR